MCVPSIPLEKVPKRMEAIKRTIKLGSKEDVENVTGRDGFVRDTIEAMRRPSV